MHQGAPGRVTDKRNVSRKPSHGARAVALIAGFLLLWRGLNVPEEMPYLFWIAMLIWFGTLFWIAYHASKRW
jgi:hypothetical protein